MMEYIDSSVFLGMHSTNDSIRIACKNYFVSRLNGEVGMSFEQVGKCDDVIWGYSRKEQDAYYPFMDNLHTLMKIRRVAYGEKDVQEAMGNPSLQDLNITDRLTIGMVMARNGKLFTVNISLLAKKGLPVHSPELGKELSFPQPLEELYQKSLEVRMSMYSGIIPPLVTPVDENGEVCEQSVKNLIDFVRPYSSALMPTLSSGEGWALNDKQWEDMVKFTLKHSSGLPVLVGVEYKTTQEVLDKAKIAKRMGVDAIVVTTPFGKDISQDEIYKHFEQLKEAKIPIFIYNEKAISGNSIEYDTLLRICKLGNIVGIKEASGSSEFTRKLIDSRIGIPIFQGWEHLCYQSVGVEGYILPLANLEPKLCLEMLNNPTAEKQSEIDSLCNRYNLNGSDWYAFLKKELHQRGIISSGRVVK